MLPYSHPIKKGLDQRCSQEGLWNSLLLSLSPKKTTAIFAGLKGIIRRGANSLSFFAAAKLYPKMRHLKNACYTNKLRVTSPQSGCSRSIKTSTASCMAIRIRSINSDLNQQIFRGKATRYRIAATIRSALLSIEKVPLPACSRKEARYELKTLKNALEILIEK